MNCPSDSLGAAGAGSIGIAMTGSASKARVAMVTGMAEAAPLPSTNAIATILSVITLLSIILGYLGYRFFSRGERAGGGLVGDMAAFDI